MNIEINRLANWFRANKMALNISKTKYIIFHTRSKKITVEENAIVYDKNEIGMPHDPSLITPLEGFHDKHPNPITADPTNSLTFTLMKPYPSSTMQTSYATNLPNPYFA